MQRTPAPFFNKCRCFDGWPRLSGGQLLGFALLFFVTSPARSEGWFGNLLNKVMPYELPNETLDYDALKPRSSIEVYSKDDHLLFYVPREPEKRQFYLELRELDPLLRQFVVLAEDAKFFNHSGLDLSEIRKAIRDNFEKGGVKRGGSTISQQLAKNLFLSHERSLTRKAFEVPWVRRIEKDLSKEEILSLYLNIIEWGPGIYGAEAAARHFFDKSARKLKVSEALYLAMIIPNPKRFDAYKGKRNIDFYYKKGKGFLERLNREHFLSSEDLAFALNEKLELATQDQMLRNFPLDHSGSYSPLNPQTKKLKSKLIGQIESSATYRSASSLTLLASKEDFYMLPETLLDRAPKDILKKRSRDQ